MKRYLFFVLIACIANFIPSNGQAHQPLRPVIFSPGVISGPANDSAPAFSPDGHTVFFSRAGAIMVSHRKGQEWSKPEIASFSGRWRDTEPAMSPDGSFMIFASSRPATEGEPSLDGAWGGHVWKGSGGNLWKVERSGSAWGQPVRLPALINRGTAIFSPAVARDGSLYFMEATMTTKFRLYRSQYANGSYQEPEPLPFSDGTWSDVDSAIAPDESFIVFASTRPPALPGNHELFIAFHKDGHWSGPEHLELDTGGRPADEMEARLSPDHRALYFSDNRTTQVVYPRSLKEAHRDLQRVQAWDNGLLNIWQVDLSPWLNESIR